MLKKLRQKFILINMTIVTIMLVLIFSLLYYSTSLNLERESIQMMKSVSMNPLQPSPPDLQDDEMRLPFLKVMINNEGETAEISGSLTDVFDAEYLDRILQAALAMQTKSGILKEDNLRFLISELPMGQFIVFTDMGSEQLILRNMVRAFIGIGGAAFLVFFGISILLAGWAVKPVDRAWQQQKQFVADASHELKTPLTVIMTDAELLHESDCPEGDRQQLSESILAMSSQMRGLVENLLDLARIDNGNVKEEFRILSFSEIVSEAAMLFEPVFFEKGLSLIYEIEPDIRISGISQHLKQLVSILLDNAVKYSSAGGETFVKFSHGTRRNCLLEVSNQGQPIPKEDLKNIFKRFYRADKARAMNHSYGLGLSIAQSIVMEHGGKIWAASEGDRNHFYVEIPCRR